MRNSEFGIRNFGRADRLVNRKTPMPDRIYNAFVSVTFVVTGLAPVRQQRKRDA